MLTDTAAIKSLRTFAAARGEVEFAHPCTAALQGEEWAAERIDAARRALAGDTFGAVDHGLALAHIRSTDCTRPDGAIARGAITPVKKSREWRRGVLEAARTLAANREHGLARAMFALVGISYNDTPLTAPTSSAN